jgi:uncharacterized protein YbbC (DUF1343 family)
MVGIGIVEGPLGTRRKAEVGVVMRHPQRQGLAVGTVAVVAAKKWSEPAEAKARLAGNPGR